MFSVTAFAPYAVRVVLIMIGVFLVLMRPITSYYVLCDV